MESEDEGERRRVSGEGEEEEAVLKKKSRSGSETSEKVRGQFVAFWLNPVEVSGPHSLKKSSIYASKIN